MVAREPSVKPSHQVVVIGQKGSGKSMLGRHLFALVESQKIFVNVKSDPDIVPWLEKRYGPENVSTVHGDVDALDFKRRVLVYEPRVSTNPDEFDELYRRLVRRRNLTCDLDEAFGPTAANRVPDHLAVYLQHGRSRNLRHYAMTQRPVNIAKAIITEADHIVFFPRGFSGHDTGYVAREMGMTEKRLKHVAHQLLSQPEVFGHYGHLWYEKQTNTLHMRPSVKVSE